MASIYVVDDNISTCKIIQKILESEGHAVKTESQALKAQDYLNQVDQKGLISVIFLDLVMPDLNGYQLLKSIKENSSFSETKVILLTSKSDPDFMMKSYGLGADYFMSKPANKKQILFALETVLNPSSNNASLS